MATPRIEYTDNQYYGQVTPQGTCSRAAVLNDLEAVQKKVEAEGDDFYMQLPADPNGVVFDMSEHVWRKKYK